MTRLDDLKKQRAALIIYGRMKWDSESDWHACADAAMDLREVESEIRGIESVGSGIHTVADAVARAKYPSSSMQWTDEERAAARARLAKAPANVYTDDGEGDMHRHLFLYDSDSCTLRCKCGETRVIAHQSATNDVLGV